MWWRRNLIAFQPAKRWLHLNYRFSVWMHWQLTTISLSLSLSLSTTGVVFATFLMALSIKLMLTVWASVVVPRSSMIVVIVLEDLLVKNQAGQRIARESAEVNLFLTWCTYTQCNYILSRLNELRIIFGPKGPAEVFCGICGADDTWTNVTDCGGQCFGKKITNACGYCVGG